MLIFLNRVKRVKDLSDPGGEIISNHCGWTVSTPSSFKGQREIHFKKAQNFPFEGCCHWPSSSKKKKKILDEMRISSSAKKGRGASRMC